ncbi:modular serine protease-like [Chelonus insularis]|uniref:modular serine protease-like n=1 Tax=Chelonus insularis TaxID=460826 RepID=UPI00158EED8F|nr:modular serine protease-like [Chelonus insularis]
MSKLVNLFFILEFFYISPIISVEIPSFICIDGFKINLSKVCDGVTDCPDSSDEVKKLCHHIVCPSSSYRCTYGACVSKSLRCDGFQNCLDNSDEMHCNVLNYCTDREYQCFDSLECISISKICNGYPDCIDQSDESPVLCKDFPCPEHTYQCTYGGCIHQETVCDGVNDCLDGSDEMPIMCATTNCKDNCSIYQCNDYEFSCTNKKQCIPLSRLCDGTHQCRDASDETLATCKDLVCPEGYFQCDYGGCIHGSLKCNFEANCHDWSDENETMCGVNLAEGACRLPPARPGTHYTVSHCSDCRPGQIVPELSRLDYFCDVKESLEGPAQVFCQNNQWFPYIPFCYSESLEMTCPPLNAPAAKKRCEASWGPRQGWIPCNESLPVGTHVTLECPEFYEKTTGATHTTCLHDGTWSQMPLHCKPICGTRGTSAAVLIIEGWEVSQEYNLPWHGTLFSHENGEWKFFCGCTLIGERVVVTAGHCVWKTDPETIKVIFNGFSSNFTINEFDENAQIRQVSSIKLQQAYQDHEGNYGSDIAILILTEPVILTANIKPICLNWSPESDISLRILDIGLVAGMGITENDTFSEKLREVAVKIISNEECQTSQKRDFKKYLTYTTFCAGWRNGSAVCNGDSGGGLALPRPNSSIWDLYGIVSISPRRLQNSFCDPKYYTVFTKVSIYSTWIDNILKNIPIIGPPFLDQLPNSDIII